ncbi:unnamed protein product [Rotaria sp. Silwood1]|nr:unnamed protein product [Rotaria sp. Silwood1]
MYTDKNLLFYQSDYDKSHLLSLPHQSNIETNSIGYNYQNSILFSSSDTNYNNSYIPLEKDNLSALYVYYQIDPQMYPPPDLQFNETIQQFFNPSHLYLQSLRLDNNNLLEQQENICNNNRQKFSNQKKDKKRLKSNRNQIKNNTQSKTSNNFHQQNIITVRRILSHDIFNSQTIMNKSNEKNNLNNETIINQWNDKTNLIENPLQNSKHYSAEYNPSLTFVELQTLPMQSITNKSFVSPLTTNHNTNILTTLVPNILFQQQVLEKKMSKSMSMTTLKVTSVNDSSTSSLAFTRLLTDDNNQTKPDVTISGSHIDFGTLSTPHLSTTSSIVPHFSSTVASHVSHHVLSSANAMSDNIHQTKSIISPILTNENIQNLVDQLKIYIDTLNLLFENKIEHKKYVISNKKSYSDDKINISEKKQTELLSSSSSSSSSSLISTRTCSRFSRQSISDGNDLCVKDIIVRRCHSFNKYQGHISMFDLFV